MHCYVIASGPSLVGFDFNALPSGFRIGANKSAWLANCDALVTVDRNFHIKFSEQIAAFGKNAYVALNEDKNTLPDVNYWTYVGGGRGLALTPAALSGSDSGFAALNLAIQLGYTDIALLGFDYKWLGGRSHFHDGYGQRPHVSAQLGRWALAHDRAAAQLEGRDIRITNFVGPMGSAVKAYPTAPLGDLV